MFFVTSVPIFLQIFIELTQKIIRCLEPMHKIKRMQIVKGTVGNVKL